MTDASKQYTPTGLILFSACLLLAMLSIGFEILLRSGSDYDTAPGLLGIVFRDAVGGVLLFRTLAFLSRKFGVAIRRNDVFDAGGNIAARPRPDFADVASDGKRFYFCSTCGRDMEIDEDDRCVGCRYTV